ncbi:hypothetical protein WAI453_011123 [Rhynchosporium graminicola]
MLLETCASHVGQRPDWLIIPIEFIRVQLDERKTVHDVEYPEVIDIIFAKIDGVGEYVGSVVLVLAAEGISKTNLIAVQECRFIPHSGPAEL